MALGQGFGESPRGSLLDEARAAVLGVLVAGAVAALEVVVQRAADLQDVVGLGACPSTGQPRPSISWEGEELTGGVVVWWPPSVKQ